MNVDEKLLMYNPFYKRISEFQGYDKAIDVKCQKCGHIIHYKRASTITYKSVICPECERRNKENNLKDFLKEYRPWIELIGEYQNLHTKVKVKCNKCGTIFEALPSNLYNKPKNKNRQGCSNCLHTKGRTNEEFLEDMKTLQPDLDFLTEYKGHFGKILCRCKKCGFEFELAPDHLYRGSKCPNCSTKYKRRTEETYKEDLNKLHPDLELIPGSYINMKQEAKFKCKKCGYEWSTNAGKIIWDNVGCPLCSKSKGERLIQKILREKDIEFIPQYSFSVNFLNRNRLDIDFYLPKYNLFIEYNGEQHYIPVKMFGGEVALQDQILRDEQLREYCKNNKINLLEIPYTYKTEEEIKVLILQNIDKLKGMS